MVRMSPTCSTITQTEVEGSKRSPTCSMVTQKEAEGSEMFSTCSTVAEAEESKMSPTSSRATHTVRGVGVEDFSHLQHSHTDRDRGSKVSLFQL